MAWDKRVENVCTYDKDRWEESEDGHKFNEIMSFLDKIASEKHYQRLFKAVSYRAFMFYEHLDC